MNDTLQSLLTEPRAPEPPARSRRDWIVFALSAALAVGGSLTFSGVEWRPAAAAVGILASACLLYRRAQPLWSLVVAFAGVGILDLAWIATDAGANEIDDLVPAGLILAYALGRWASGREIAIGVPVILSGLLIGNAAASDLGWSLIFGAPFWLLPTAIGLTVRYRDRVRRQGIADARSSERERLARELHDVVAHHVSAITIMAQAGKAVATTRPESALDALDAIEAAASAALEEMRSMVGALRADHAAELAPQSGLADIVALARDDLGGPPVEVEIADEVGVVPGAVGTALFRVAQEATTNARRHARHATRISVMVEREGDELKLEVSDDGDAPGATKAGGYGLVGMNERMQILGGTFDAGPSTPRGWIVQASLPAPARTAHEASASPLPTGPQ